MKKSFLYFFMSCFLMSLMMIFINSVSYGQVSPHPSLLKRIEANKLLQESIYSIKNASSFEEKGIDAPWSAPELSANKSFGLNSFQRSYGPAKVPSGNWNALVVLVKFSDKPSQVVPTFFDNLLFGNQFGSMKDYYAKVSYSALNITSANLPSTIAWVQAPQTYAYYCNNQNGTGNYPNNSQKLVEDVVALLDPTIDFSKYDNDQDGYVDALFIVHTGPGAEYTGNNADIWSHAWSVNTPINVDGTKVFRYSTEPEYWSTPGDMTMGVYAHELGHAAFGLPDVYDRDGSSAGLGGWSLMAGGSWNGTGTGGNYPALPDAWCHAQMGYITPSVITANSVGNLIPQVETNSKAYILWKGGSFVKEYFLIENRQQVDYDQYLPGNGLLVYHIDQNITSQNDREWYPGLSPTNHFLVALEQADGLWNLEKRNNSGDAADPFPGTGNKTTFSNSTTPDTKDYLLTATGVSIKNIGASGANISADFEISTSEISLKVSSPNGGEKFPVGYSKQIILDALNVGSVNVEYSTDNGNTWTFISTVNPVAKRANGINTMDRPNNISLNSENDLQLVGGAIDWIIPNTPSTQCKIRATSATNPALTDQSDNVFSIIPVPPGQFAVQFNYDANTVTGSAGNAGAIFIPTLSEFWTSRWATNLMHRWNKNGTLIAEFSIDGVSNTRGMTFDGTNLYLANASTTISIINPSTRLKTGTIIAPVTARYITFDPTADNGNGGFWIGDFNSNAVLINRSGIQLRSIPYATLGSQTNYGAAFDNHTPGGPYLWFASQAPLQKIIQVSVATGLPTGIEHDMAFDIGASSSGILSGGIFVSTGIVNGKATIGGMLQGNPNRLFGYQLCDLVPNITVISPNGGEIWKSGTIKDINWSSGLIDKVKIEYSVNNGVDWVLIANEINASSNNYKWIVPNTLSNKYKIKITAIGVNNVYDESDAIFIVSDKEPLEIKYDVANASGWFGGDDRTGIGPRNIGIGQSVIFDKPYYINSFSLNFSSKFDYSGSPTNVGHEVVLVLTIRNANGTFIKKIEKTLPASYNGGWVQWNEVDLEVSTNTKLIFTCNLKGAFNNNLNTGYVADSNAGFANGDSYSSSGTDDISMENWNNWGIHSWDVNFWIKGYPTADFISLIAPNGGEQWKVGAQKEIKWSTSLSGNVKIELTLNNGTNWSEIVASTSASSGKYLWTVPNTTSTNCKIRITDVANASLTDVSDNTFIIRTSGILAEIEPNNTRDLANSIAYSDTVDAAISPINDLDYYKFEGAQGDTVVVYGEKRGANNLEGRIRLLNSSGNNLRESSYFTTSLKQRVVYVLPSTGTYYIRYSYRNNLSGIPPAEIEIINEEEKEIKDRGPQLDTYDEGEYRLILNKFKADKPIFVYAGVDDVNYNSTRFYTSFYTNGLPTKVTAEYGLTTSYGNNVVIGENINELNYSIIITSAKVLGLTANTQYNYRIKLENAMGIVFSNNSAFTTAAAPIGWSFANSGTVSNFYGVDFADANVGFAVGNGGIFKTVNGGTDWFNVSTQSTMYGIDVVNASLLFAVGTNMRVVKSVDGGTSWTSAQLPNDYVNSSISFLDANNGMLVTEGGRIYKTVDGGTTWTEKYFANFYTGSLNWKIKYLNSNIAIAAGGIGFVLKSIDGGNTWNDVYGNNESIRALEVIDPNTYIISGDNFVSKTLDGGNNWIIKSMPETYYSIRFNDVTTGRLAGDIGKVYKTIDGGQTWNIDGVTGTNNFICGIATPTPQISIAVGAWGTILKSGTYLTILSPNGGERFKIGSNYDIKWSSGLIDKVKIEYSVNGGASWLPIAENITASLGKYPWTIPNNQSTNCKVKISDQSNTSLFDISDASFTIATSGVIAEVEPNNDRITAMSVVLADTVNAAIQPVGDIDYYKIDGIVGDTLVVYAQARNNSMLAGHIYMLNSDGNVLYDGFMTTSYFEGVYEKQRGILVLPYTGTYFIKYAYKFNNSAVTGLTYSSINNNDNQVEVSKVPDLVSGEGDYQISFNKFKAAKPQIGGHQIVNVKTNSAAINLIVYPNGLNTKAELEFGTSISYDQKIVLQSNAIDLNYFLVTEIPITSLLPATTYHYRIVVSNSLGTNYSADFSFVTAPVSTQWTAINAQTQCDFTDIDFINNNQGIAVGWGHHVQYGMHGYIYSEKNIFITNDGGINWAPKEVLQLAQKKYVDFVDQNKIVIGGWGLVYSNDGGTSWTQKQVGSAWINSISFFNNNVGYLTNGELYKTVDGGANWTKIEMNGLYMSSVKAIDLNLVYASSGGKFLKSIDGGSTWNTVELKTSSEESRLSFSSSQNGIFNIGSSVFSTTNGGANWTEKIVPYFYGITQFDSQNALGVSWDGLIQRTSDGVNWNAELSGTRNTLSDVIFTPNKNTLVVGDFGTILRSGSFLNVVTPNGGEQWKVGSQKNISWKGNAGSVNIQLSVNGGAYSDIATNYSSIGNNYLWTIPNLVSDNCKIKIISSSNSAISDESDNPFSIIPAGDYEVISSCDVNDASYWKMDGSGWNNPTKTFANFSTVSEKKYGTGSLKIDWSVENSQSWGGYANITHIEPAGSVYNLSAYNSISFWFNNQTPSTINNAVMQLRFLLWDCSDSPNGINTTNLGELEEYYGFLNRKLDIAPGWNKITIPLKAGLYWDGEGFNLTGWAGIQGNKTLNLDKIKAYGIEFSYQNNGVGTGEVATGTILVDHIVAENNSYAFLLSPNGGEQWKVGTQREIEWNTSSSGNVKIELSVNNGTNWSEIVASTSASSGKYLWTVPNTPSANCKIRITDVANASLTDVSDNIFTIRTSGILTETEPNNTMQLANIVAYGDTVDAAISPLGDLDYYKFQGVQGDTIVVYGEKRGTNTLEGRIWLRDQNGNNLYTTNPYLNTWQKQRLVYVLPYTGTYYLRYAYLNNWSGTPQSEKDKYDAEVKAEQLKVGSFVNTPQLGMYDEGEYRIIINYFKTSAPLLNYAWVDDLNFNSVRLGGSVYPNGLPTKVTAEYGLTNSYGNSIEITTNANGFNEYRVTSSKITGLLPNTLYHFRILLENSKGAVASSDYTFTTSLAPLGWSFANSGTESWLFGVDFLDANVGYSAGDAGIFKTLDGGSTWVNVFNQSGMYVVDVVNSATVFAAGYNRKVIKTIDGGANWTTIQLPNDWANSGISFIDANNGMLVTEGGRIYKTVDGGTTWIEKYFANYYSGSLIWKIKYINSNIAIAAGGNGFVLKTIDGGNTWTDVYPNNNDIRALEVIDENKYVITGWGFTARTIDGGANWVITNMNDGYYGIKFTDANNGRLTGNGGRIYKTNDGGLTWNLDGNTGTNNTLFAISKPTPQSTIVVGGWGTILKSLGRVQVTFKADLNVYGSLGLFTKGTDKVYLRGSFNSWDLSNEMSDANNDGIYELTLDLAQSSTYEYKFFTNSSKAISFGWERNVGEGGSGNRILQTTTEAMTVNHYFDNISKPILITNPVANSTFKVGGATDIKWLVANTINNIKIEYSIDEGINWNPIISTTPAQLKKYYWVIPNTTSSQCKIKITDVAIPSNVSISEGLFTIKPAGIIAEKESNNTIQLANSVAYSDTVDAAITPIGDVDYYKFVGSQGDTVLVYGEKRGVNTLEGRIRIHMEDGNLLTENSYFLGTSNKQRVVFILPYTGSYFIRYSYTNNLTGIPPEEIAKIKSEENYDNNPKLTQYDEGEYRLIVSVFKSAKPQISSVGFTDINYNSARVMPTFVTNGLPTTVTVEYGTTTGYGSSFSYGPFNEFWEITAWGKIINLSPNTLYHFRVKVENSKGSEISSNYSFTTPLNPDGWVHLNSSSDALLYNTDFVNANFGVVVGTNGTLLITSNGGTNWANKYPSGEIIYTLNNVDVINTSKIVAVGSMGFMFISNDGGNSFVKKQIGTSTIRSVSFIDANTGVICNSVGEIYKTVDGGTNWTKLNSPTSVLLYFIKMVDANKIIAGGASQTYVSSSDGGTTWNKQTISIAGTNMYGASFLDLNNGLIAGSGGKVLKTVDGGSTWNALSINSAYSYRSVSYINSTTAIVVGASGIIYKTIDSGANWTQLNSGTSNILYGVITFDTNTSWAVGDWGKILKYSSTASTTTITSFSPESGTTGTVVTINGTGFGATQGTSRLRFGTFIATPTSWSDTQIIAPIPAAAFGIVNVNVRVNNITVNSSSLITINKAASNIWLGYNTSVTDHSYNSKIYSDAWPKPTYTVNEKPVGMNIIANDSLAWVPNSSHIGGNRIIISSGNTFGTLLDTVYIVNESIKSAENQIKLDITNRGKLGESTGRYNKGLFYKTQNGLYAGDFSLVDRDNLKYAGGLYTNYNSFRPLTEFVPVQSRYSGFTAYQTTFNDEWEGPNRIGVKVYQTINSSTNTGNDKFAIVEYKIVNESASAIADIFAQVTTDFDIGNALKNLGGYDPTLQMIYGYESDGATNTNYYGYALLNSSVSGASVFGNGTDNQYMRSVGKLTVFETTPAQPSDYRYQINAGPFNLAQNQDVTYIFAFFAGDNLDDIKASAAKAKQVYNSSQFTWTSNITIKDKDITGNATLIFGAASTATDAIDSHLGESALPPVPPSGIFDSRFILPNGNEASVKDFRKDGQDSTTWSLAFQPGSSGYPITFTWDNSSLPEGSFILTDELTGTIVNVDMKAANTYTLTNTGIKTLLVKYSKEISSSVKFAAAWNIISVPLKTKNMNTTIMFPDYSSSTYEYNNGYKPVTLLENGKGYWLRYKSVKTEIVKGTKVNSSSISVLNGWNLIGAYTNEITVSSITTTPSGIINSQFYEYDPLKGYQVPTKLLPGKGYWIRVNANGVLNIGIAGTALAKTNAENKLRTGEIDSEWNRITIKDNANRTLTTYATNQSIDKSSYELPPTPPKGIFDIRWETGSLVENLISGSKELLINSAEYPITITITGMDARIKDSYGAQFINKIIKKGESITISNKAIDRILVERLEIPTEYALLQNYPNPFNPETAINYQLPVAGKVTLKIYDVLGREVETLLDEYKEAGVNEIKWNAAKYGSGVYFYRIVAGNFTSIKKMILLK